MTPGHIYAILKLDMADAAARILNRQTDRYAKRLAFIGAIKAGNNVSQAARISGISRQTGAIWKKHIDNGEFNNVPGVERLLTKQETLEILAKIARDEEQTAAYRINALSLEADVQGKKAPARSLVEVRQVPASVVAWLNTEFGALPPADDTKALPPGDPNSPKDGTVRPPGQICEKSEKATSDVIDVDDESDEEK